MAVTLKEWANRMLKITLVFLLFVLTVNACGEACKMDRHAKQLKKQTDELTKQ